MLVGLDAVLPVLNERKACLAGFDIAGGQSDFVLGIVRACEAARCPALLLVWAPGATYVGMELCADIVKFVAGRSTVPVIMHLDHGHDEELVEKCLKLGYKSVMFDGSRFPFDENVRRTKEMVKLAHSYGATIEGELGKIGQEQGYGDGSGVLTDPGEALAFVKQTGVDLFAPAVGNAHGWYKAPPKLRFELVDQIHRETGTALSLHGGTGIPMEDLRKCAALGVRKLNVATLLHKAFTDALRGRAMQEGPKPAGWRDMLDAGRDTLATNVTEYIRELRLGGLV